MAEIPTFALLGLPNSGKTTLVSTLSFDISPEISHRDGSTTISKHIPIRINGKKRLDLIDTPGVQKAQKMLEWFIQQEDSKSASAGVLAKRFCDEHASGGDFKPECELLKELTEDVAIIYIADPSYPPSADDECLIETLRLCNNQRFAIINTREGASEDNIAKWYNILKRGFTYTEKMDGVEAHFEQVIDFFDIIKTTNPQWKGQIVQLIEELKDDRALKLEAQADAFLDFISEMTELEVSAPIDKMKSQNSIKAALFNKLKEKLQEMEERYIKATNKRFNTKDFLNFDRSSKLDVFNEETQTILGLSTTKWRAAATLAGATSGAAIGGAVDLGTGGGTLGGGTAIGGGIGAIVGFASSFIPTATTFAEDTVNNTYQSKIDFKKNLHWAILNKIALFSRIAANWAHGNRSKITLTEERLKEIKHQDLFYEQNSRELVKLIKELNKGSKSKRDTIVEHRDKLRAKLVAYLSHHQP